MKLTDSNSTPNNDVLVMFPASKHFPIGDDVKQEQSASKEVKPLSELVNEFEAEVAKVKEERRPVMAIPSKESIKAIRSTRSCQTAMEIRLAALEEIEKRLKFYLEDMGTSKRSI
ncbi:MULTISPECIES: hypothetical protein [Halobacteriovorax]|uniref:Uncharacterized protein n=1 Tax=Halobacteriovorax vibrionivorans TaxID=2152716 RepID=A0ABY0IBP9_9BACT|nr:MULTISPECIES: hypothetical protein [Halobacteriovorax]AYF44371.1 hypothetical protein BALOs_1368 [Halobacteriovorax sp. BALOs_7]RZF20387.1 hypothetical protein DAY19_14590 [Halobacteriovorax vibrionivorans]TGD46560.1 hypothetical protein EP118_11350 [Halobacteriovorax sp. Y22]